MNVISALLPNKHVKFCNSLIAISGYIMQFMNTPVTVDELWAKLKQKKNRWPGVISYTSMLLAIDILYSLKQIQSVDGLRITRTQAHETE